jgi:hypothetical protein
VIVTVHLRGAAMAIAGLLLTIGLAAGRAQTTQDTTSSPATGTLVVQVDPPATVYVDGALVSSSASGHRATVSAGPRRLRVVHPDYEDLRRTVDVKRDTVTTLAFSLAEKGVRRAPANAERGRGGVPRGGTNGRVGAAALVTDADLARGIEFVKQGDFAPAAEALLGVSRNLAGVPRMIGQQALAYLYFGVASLELDRVEDARRAFALAQRLDKALAPKATEFSAETLAMWEEARAIPADEEIDFSTPAAAAPDPIAEPVVKDAAADPDAEFIEESGGLTTFDFVVPTAGLPCGGSLAIDRQQRSVAWTPLADGCVPSFVVPFAEVRSPAQAPHGGLLLQFRSDRPSIVLMPTPDADLLEGGVDKLTLNDLPPSTRVHLRRALRRMFDALGRPWSDSLTGLLVDVSVGQLLESPSDYDGGLVRASGTLKTQSAGKGPYLLTEDNAVLEVVPTGATTALMRARASEWVGKELLVSGTFARPAITTNSPKGPSRPKFVITATAIELARDAAYSGPARSAKLEELVKDPPRTRELVRVVGKYRGKNFYGDLPMDSRRQPTDWVIKDDLFAVWVTGKPPAGSGFSLDSTSNRDLSSSWVAVTGTIEERKGFVYLRADKIELSLSPSDAAKVVDPRRRTGAANVRPDISFTVPVPDVEEASRDQQLLVQFTKPMDEKSFAGNVQLRYVDGTETFSHLSVTYYPDRTYSVMIDPGTALQPGKTLECVFLPGVKDLDGQLLIGTDAAPGRVLRWKVRGGR